MPSDYDGTTDIELQSLNPTTSTRAPGQSRSDAEHDIQSAAPTASSSKPTTDLPETLTKLTHALEHLRREFVTQDAKLIRSEASTDDGRPHHIDHELRKKVRGWLNESLIGTRTGSRPTIPHVSPPISRFLMARAGSKNPVTREAARLVRAEAESIARRTADAITIKNKPRGERRERDQAEIKAVIASWGASV
jgi:hypothetical protein